MDKGSKIRVLIADDFDMLRQVMRKVLERTDDIEVAGEALRLQEALAKTQPLQPDVILMDDYLPSTNSAAVTKLFRESGMTTAILVISMKVEPELIEQTLASGAKGFIHKDEMGTLLVEAIHSVFHHGRYLSPKAISTLTDEN